jgi:hypothetical protein
MRIPPRHTDTRTVRVRLTPGLVTRRATLPLSTVHAAPTRLASVILASLTLVFVIAGTSSPAGAVGTSSPDAGTRVPCTTEDTGARGCVFDARHTGNGSGRSFVLPTGSADDRVTYVSHARAHYLLTGRAS